MIDSHGSDPSRATVWSRRSLLVAAAAALAAAQVGCGSGTQSRTNEEAGMLTAGDVTRAAPPTDAPIAAIAAGMTDAAHRLLRAETTLANWIASPLSLACAFAMARVGARGATAEQLDRYFGFPSRGRDDAFKAATRQLVTGRVPVRAADPIGKPGRSPAAPIVSLGNALFLQTGFRVGTDFLRTLALSYGNGVHSVDFSTPAAIRAIDDWVSAQTAGRITKLFDSLDASTALVLANAVFFQADWQHAFEAQLTAPAPFTHADQATTSVSMMHQSGTFRYGSVSGAEILELPYASGSGANSPYAMWVMLPAPGASPDTLLTSSAITALGASLASTSIDVYLPRFDFATDIDLASTMGATGLPLPFGGAADFSGIAAGLSIAQATHRANITVGELGTVAAAVTGMSMMLSLEITPNTTRTFRADRPFAFAIMGGDHHVPLFVGRVVEPSAT
jgi:serpin B